MSADETSQFDDVLYKIEMEPLLRDLGIEFKFTGNQILDEMKKKHIWDLKRELEDTLRIQDETEFKFRVLALQWNFDTAIFSSASDIVNHPSYQEIIRMGEEVVPFMLTDFKRGKLHHWFFALHKITGANPVPPEYAGRIRKMAEYWVQWGIDNGYLLDLGF